MAQGGLSVFILGMMNFVPSIPSKSGAKGSSDGRSDCLDVKLNDSSCGCQKVPKDSLVRNQVQQAEQEIVMWANSG